MAVWKMSLIGGKARKVLEIMSVILIIDSVQGSCIGNQQFNCPESLCRLSHINNVLIGSTTFRMFENTRNSRLHQVVLNQDQLSLGIP